MMSAENFVVMVRPGPEPKWFRTVVCDIEKAQAWLPIESMLNEVQGILVMDGPVLYHDGHVYVESERVEAKNPEFAERINDFVFGALTAAIKSRGFGNE